MSISNPLFGFYGPALFSIEVGNFLKAKFEEFDLFDPIRPTPRPKVKSQIHFGTPRAALVFNRETHNGKAILPMVNYQLTNTEKETSTAYEPDNLLLYRNLNKDVDGNITDTHVTGMPMPSRYNLTYTISIWNNNYRERDCMMHMLIQHFNKGETSLGYYPNKTTNPNDYLLMRCFWDGNFSDDSDLETLEITNTRDVIKSTFTFVIQALIPKRFYEIPLVLPPQLIEVDASGKEIYEHGIWVVEAGVNKVVNNIFKLEP